MLKILSIRFTAAVTGVIVLCSWNALAADAARVVQIPAAHPAPLIIAPDRGFQGNEEIRDALEVCMQGTPGEIVFVTDERTRDTLKRATQRLTEAGAREVVVLPLFLSASDPSWLLAQRCLADLTNTVAESSGAAVVLTQARPFGRSYFAVEVLADRLRAIANPAGRDVIVVGCAEENESVQALEKDWQRLATLAAEGFGFKSVRALVWPANSRTEGREKSKEVERMLADLVINGERVAVVPFHLGKKLDGMMTFNAGLRSKIPKAAEWIESDVTPHSAVTLWIAREVNRHTPFRAEDLGVVFLAHGSDYHWNETMREAIASLTDRYQIEFCFSMADPPLVERAVRRLEQRGARGIVVVRVFGLADSFERNVKRALGLDVEESFHHAARSTKPFALPIHDFKPIAHRPALLLMRRMIITATGTQAARNRASVLPRCWPRPADWRLIPSSLRRCWTAPRPSPKTRRVKPSCSSRTARATTPQMTAGGVSWNRWPRRCGPTAAQTSGPFAPAHGARIGRTSAPPNWRRFAAWWRTQPATVAALLSFPRAQQSMGTNASSSRAWNLNSARALPLIPCLPAGWKKKSAKARRSWKSVERLLPCRFRHHATNDSARNTNLLRVAESREKR